MEYVTQKLPSVLVNFGTTCTVIGILVAIVFPWYKIEVAIPDPANCTTYQYEHVFYQYISCGSCPILDCLTVAPDGGGLDFKWTLLVNAITWILSIFAFMCVLLGALFSWVPMFQALRWLSRTLLAAASLLSLTAFFVYLAYTPAYSADYRTETGLPCAGGPCKDFVGNDSAGYWYWGPSGGWICAVISSFFVIVATLISCFLASPEDATSYESITSY